MEETKVVDLRDLSDHTAYSAADIVIRKLKELTGQEQLRLETSIDSESIELDLFRKGRISALKQAVEIIARYRTVEYE